MKSLLLVVTLLLGAFTLSSCTSTNDVKIKVATEAQKLVEKELTKAYEGVEIADYSCASEVEEIGGNVYTEVSKFLKIKESTSDIIGSSLLVPVCKLIGKKYLPELIIGSSGGKYRCLKYIGADGVKKISDKLCDYIKL